MDFDSRFGLYCSGNDFKRYVRQVVSDEMFWRDCLSSFATRDVLSHIPEKVQNETNRVVPQLVRQELDAFSRNQIPSHVSKSLVKQLPGFLNNNVQMQQILQQHSGVLSQQLSEAAHTVLDRVVNEDQYHTMTNRLSAAITQKSEDNLKRLDIEANKRLDANDNEFKAALLEMRAQVTGELEQVYESNRLVAEQSAELKRLQNEVSSLRWFFGIFAGSAVVVAAIGLFRHLN